MSMIDEIHAHISAGALHLVLPPNQDALNRKMLITNDIYDLLTGPWASADVRERARWLRADLEQFADGTPVSMSLNQKKHREAYFARLDSPEDEVWELRSRAPKPGLRLFGRFAAADVFVALFWLPRSRNWNGRRALKSGKNYEYEIAKIRCAEEWNKLFPDHPPATGDSLDEYVSDAFPVRA